VGDVSKWGVATRMDNPPARKRFRLNRPMIVPPFNSIYIGQYRILYCRVGDRTDKVPFSTNPFCHHRISSAVIGN
jgi:hypothetical protein